MKKLFIIAVSIFLFIISCSSDGTNIDMVKHGAFEAYPDITVGEMVDAIFDEVQWEEIVAEDGNDYVNMHGTLEGDKASIQFRILDDDYSLLEKLSNENNLTVNKYVQKIIMDKINNSK